MKEKDIIEFCDSYSINDHVDSLEKTIRVNMGLDGDDAFYFLKDFEHTFDFKFLDKLNFEKYFHTEYELFNKYRMREFTIELKIIDILENIGNTFSKEDK